MKKLMIAFSILSAGALIACADNSVKPNYDAQSWFGAKVTNGNIDEVGGKFVQGPGSTCKVSDGKIEIDSELSDPVSFKLDDVTVSLTAQLARVTFELDPSVVPYSSLPESTDLEGVKVAFALCEKEEDSGTATNFYVWAGTQWTSLNFTNIPTDTYKLTMTFDESTTGARKVQFATDSETSDPLDYASDLYKQRPQINFVGSGKIKELAADQLKFVSAEIEITGGSVTIDAADIDAMGALVQSGETLKGVLEANVTTKFTTIDSKCNLNVAEAYAIGLIAKEGTAMVAKADGTFKVKADATATTTDGIKVGFVDTLTPNDKTAKITYKLMGSTTGAADSYTVIVSEKKELDAIKIPTDSVATQGYRYFKVVTKVDLSK